MHLFVLHLASASTRPTRANKKMTTPPDQQQATPASESGVGTPIGSNSRRSIFSPQERSQTAQSNGARDLTRSARVRAVRLEGTNNNNNASSSSATATGTTTATPNKTYGGVDSDTSPPEKPGYVGQRTSKRLSPSTKHVGSSADGGTSTTGRQHPRSTSNVDDADGDSPGAWALRHARELAPSDDDLGQLVEGQLVGEGNVLVAAQANSGGRALPPRPAATGNTYGRTAIASSRDSSYRSRADSEGGDTVPM